MKRPRRGGAQSQLLQAAADMLTSADVVTTPSDKTGTPGARSWRPTPASGWCPTVPIRCPTGHRFRRRRVRGSLYVGRIVAREGPRPAAGRVRPGCATSIPNAELMIVGDWQRPPRGCGGGCSRAARRGCTQLVGRVPRDQLGAYYSGADVFVFPSLTDTQALVLHEAALCGLPFVIVDPELNLVVDPGVNALVARPNVVSLSQAIMSMLRQLQDPGFAGRADERSRELAGQWTIERQANEMMSIYTDLMAGRPVPVSEGLAPDLGRPRLGGRLH